MLKVQQKYCRVANGLKPVAARMTKRGIIAALE